MAQVQVPSVNGSRVESLVECDGRRKKSRYLARYGEGSDGWSERAGANGMAGNGEGTQEPRNLGTLEAWKLELCDDEIEKCSGAQVLRCSSLAFIGWSTGSCYDYDYDYYPWNKTHARILGHLPWHVTVHPELV